ncbi:zeaxanthin chloroplastic-like [Chlorella sorokiniana]|uniref:Zeaxanthin chloroplastic-like n=1 Tax=Chlorella sorokiniana TaxID=3076 RepID=A0A2P6TVC3_CHLSO|nr:zeaxanthin chloroplastic-like [Chlorella sorokiniana]|eukprot:PRW58015.1 zeaxanthin chloroplastic-like [Chlorella sorokiniana]
MPPAALAAGPYASALEQRDLWGTVVVTGAGPAGLAAAVALHRAGLPVLLLEREAGLPAGGSALGIWTNGWRALDALGAGDALRRQHPALQDVELVRQSGTRLRRFSFSDCDGGPHEFRGVRRSHLLAALAAHLPPASIAFGSPVAAAEATEAGAALRLASGQRLECLAIVGADGARSAVAAAAGRAPPNHCGQTAIRGIARFAGGVPAELQAACIRQVWGPGARAGTYQISDTELYWFCCFDAPADQSAAAATSPEAWRQEALQVVRGWAWGLPAAVEATAAEDLSRSRLVDRWALPPASSGRISVTLAGDALHPMTPNLGQGGCTALEDALVLGRSLQQAGAPALAAALQDSLAGGGAGGTAQRQQQAAAAAVREAIGRYERERTQRCLPLTVRSHLMGAALQSNLPPVVLARDLFVQRAFSPAHFLDHAAYDCGRLEGAPLYLCKMGPPDGSPSSSKGSLSGEDQDARVKFTETGLPVELPCNAPSYLAQRVLIAIFSVLAAIYAAVFRSLDAQSGGTFLFLFAAAYPIVMMCLLLTRSNDMSLRKECYYLLLKYKNNWVWWPPTGKDYVIWWQSAFFIFWFITMIPQLVFAAQNSDAWAEEGKTGGVVVIVLLLQVVGLLFQFLPTLQIEESGIITLNKFLEDKDGEIDPSGVERFVDPGPLKDRPLVVRKENGIKWWAVARYSEMPWQIQLGSPFDRTGTQEFKVELLEWQNIARGDLKALRNLQEASWIGIQLNPITSWLYQRIWGFCLVEVLRRHPDFEAMRPALGELAKINIWKVCISLIIATLFECYAVWTLWNAIVERSLG